jgi:anhydro-N-acetylmuramic acid kinase
MSNLVKVINKQKRRGMGLMSGTSCDGINVCLAEIAGAGPGCKVTLLGHDRFEYPDKLRKRILDLCLPETSSVDKICHMNFLLGELFAEAALKLIRKLRLKPEDVDLIGSHGQTIQHLPAGIKEGDRLVRSTLQIAEPAIIAERTGITTVADFRTRDIAAGGFGAPLVPYADYILFADKTTGRALQNIGGIANVTYLASGGSPKDIIAFDTGPGNMVIDRITVLTTHGRLAYDAEGEMAAEGVPDEKFLQKLMNHPYLAMKPPKTTGREDFGMLYTDKLFHEASRGGISHLDLLATVTAFTAKSMADEYKRFVFPHGDVSQVILCGGGSYNRTLVKYFQIYLGQIPIKQMDDFGIPCDAKEALSFAILANETISGNPNNVPSATGAEAPVILGKIIPGR